MLFLIKQENKSVWNDIFTHKTGHLTLFLYSYVLLININIFITFHTVFKLGFKSALPLGLVWSLNSLIHDIQVSPTGSYIADLPATMRVIPAYCRISLNIMMPPLMAPRLLVNLFPPLRFVSLICIFFSSSSTKYQIEHILNLIEILSLGSEAICKCITVGKFLQLHYIYFFISLHVDDIISFLKLQLQPVEIH